VKELVRALLPRAVRPHRILAGPLRGTWLVASWHDYPAGLTGRTERPLLAWFGRHVRAGDTWIDIGAHYGYTAFALARLVGERGRVVAFEPVPATAGCVDQGTRLNGFRQLTVVPLGLGAAETIEPRRLTLRRGMADSTAHVDHAVTVGALFARLDWLWPTLAGADAPIHGVKMDVQGMELDALEGMRQSLARWRPHVVVELHAGVSRERVLELFGSLGYSAAAEPIEPARGERAPLFLDDRSYAFTAV
jgi:FkbM family methyltransferase